jgi:hypothetical protein
MGDRRTRKHSFHLLATRCLGYLPQDPASWAAGGEEEGSPVRPSKVKTLREDPEGLPATSYPRIVPRNKIQLTMCQAVNEECRQETSFQPMPFLVRASPAPAVRGGMLR